MGNAAQPKQVSPNAAGFSYSDNGLLVQVKSGWSGTWRTIHALTPVTWSEATAPTMPTATFEYDYGHIKREWRTTFGQDDPKPNSDWFIKILSLSNAGASMIWCGVIAENEVTIDGPRSGEPQGTQVFKAFGLEHLLDRHPISKAYVEEQSAIVEIDRVQPFNRPAGFGKKIFGNMSDETYPGGVPAADENDVEVHLFSKDGQEWTHKKVLDYVLHFFSPSGMKFVATGIFSRTQNGVTKDDGLALIKSVLTVPDLTPHQMINKLILRNRGMTWKVVTTGSGKIHINVFSVVDEDVSSGEFTMSANPNPVRSLPVDTHNLMAAIVRKTTTSKFETINILGADLKACCTLSFNDLNFNKAWDNVTGTLEDEYKAEATGDQDRRRDKYNRVYRQFRIVDDWDWLVGNGLGNAFQHSVNVSCDDNGKLIINSDGIPQAAANFWNDPNRGFLRDLPLQKEPDTDDAGINVRPQYKKPMVFAQNQREDNEYFQVDQPCDNGIPVLPFKMTETEMGIKFSPGINHIMALNHFDPKDHPPGSKLKDPRVDYETLVATVFIETDNKLHVIVKTGLEPTVLGLTRELTIKVPDAELWYIVPDTVVGALGGVLVHFDPEFPNPFTFLDPYEITEKYILRDDSERLRQIGALAKAWYSKARTALSVRVKYLDYVGMAGRVIGQVTSGRETEQVNAVVSSVTWTNDEEGITSSFETDFAEMDFVRIADTPGLSDPRAVGRHVNRLDSEVQEIRERVGDIPTRDFEHPFQLEVDLKHVEEKASNHSTNIKRTEDGRQGDLDEFLCIRAALHGDLRQTGLKPNSVNFPNTRPSPLEPDEDEAPYRTMLRADESYKYIGIGDVAGFNPITLTGKRDAGYYSVPGPPTRTQFLRADTNPIPGKFAQWGDAIYLERAWSYGKSADLDDRVPMSLCRDLMFYIRKDKAGALHLVEEDATAALEGQGTYIKGDLAHDTGLAGVTTRFKKFEPGKFRPRFRSPITWSDSEGIPENATFPADVIVTKAISSGTSTLSTTGPTDNVNVSDINVLFIDASSNNVTIGGFVGGVIGQKLSVAIIDGTNDVTLEHEEGGGDQDILLHKGLDETLSGEYGGWDLVCDGSKWYDTSHAKHI